MALIRPIHGEMSGSIAGNTYSRNKGGLYVKRAAHPTNPNSVLQQAARATLQSISAGWASLTEDQRDNWNQYAAANPRINRLGESFFATGHQWYVALNARLADVQRPGVTSAPVLNTVPTLTAASVASVVDPDTVSVTWSATGILATDVISLWLTPQHSEGSSPNFRQARSWGASEPGQSSPTSITGKRLLTEGNTYTAYVMVVTAEGLASVPLKAKLVPAYP